MKRPTVQSLLVTGGTGFLGSALVRCLVERGHRVRVLDNNSRGDRRRLAENGDRVELVEADIRDAAAVEKATAGVDGVFHLASLNGTEFFYQKPDLVLEVGVKGMVNVMDACVKHRVKELLVASSSEVYQTPPSFPAAETVPLSIPDPMNPRYSYATTKILNEVMAVNYGRKYFERVIIFRPHNVYGRDMGWEHVIPQFVLRMKELCRQEDGPVRFPIQGTGRETRAFMFIDDFVAALLRIWEEGEHLNIYNIGTMEEVAIAQVAAIIGKEFGRQVEILPGRVAEGSPSRRCPDTSKLAAMGFRPSYTLEEGLPGVVRWYRDHVPPDPGPVHAGRDDGGE